MIYLASALILMWLLVGGYLLFMLARQRTLEKELRSLEERFQDRGHAD
jgi:CcmD family protein